MAANVLPYGRRGQSVWRVEVEFEVKDDEEEEEEDRGEDEDGRCARGSGAYAGTMQTRCGWRLEALLM
jgi:hypothetical protein